MLHVVMENAVSTMGDTLVGLLFIDLSFFLCMRGRQAGTEQALWQPAVPRKHERDDERARARFLMLGAR